MEAARRILVVDDSPEIRDVLTRFFSETGHEIRGAVDGKQGLEQVREWEPHLMLLDLEMPRMNGLDVLRHLQAHHPDVTVIAFSGHSAAEHLGGDARRLGAAEFLVKPFELEQLDAAVRGLLDDSSV